MLNHFGLSELLNKVACPGQCLSVLVYHRSLVKMDRSHFIGQASGQELPPSVLAMQTLSGIMFNQHSELYLPSQVEVFFLLSLWCWGLNP